MATSKLANRIGQLRAHFGLLPFQYSLARWGALGRVRLPRSSPKIRVTGQARIAPAKRVEARAARAKSNRGQRYTPHQNVKFPAMILAAPEISVRGRLPCSQMDGMAFPIGR
jgi:hypothetical protein